MDGTFRQLEESYKKIFNINKNSSFSNKARVERILTSSFRNCGVFKNLLTTPSCEALPEPLPLPLPLPLPIPDLSLGRAPVDVAPTVAAESPGHAMAAMKVVVDPLASRHR